jgi:hypothetical protein
VLIRGDQLNRALLFDAGSAEPSASDGSRKLGAAIARVKQRGELTLLRHTIALPNNSAALTLRLAAERRAVERGVVRRRAARRGVLDRRR